MKALTITEPWATLVAIGAKRIETRSWPAPADLIGQRIAIHAGKGMTTDDLDAALDDGRIERALASMHESGLSSAVVWPVFTERQAGRVSTAFRDTRGCVIATATLTGCFRFTEATVEKVTERFGHDEIAFGDYGYGRFGFYLTDVIRLPEPIPATGALGFWEWEPPDAEIAA